MAICGVSQTFHRVEYTLACRDTDAPDRQVPKPTQFQAEMGPATERRQRWPYVVLKGHFMASKTRAHAAMQMHANEGHVGATHEKRNK